METKGRETNNQKVYKDEVDININILPGDRNGSPDESYFTFVLIDGAFLSKLSKFFGDGRFLIYDISKFSENLASKEKLKCSKIFYYTAPPFQSNKPTKEEEIRKEGYDKFVKKLKQRGIIVREGRCQRLQINNKEEFHQKAVDILLAMDMMNVPLKYKNIKKIILIASDSDFVPIIKNLEKNNVKTILYTFYQKKRNVAFSRSNHLIKAVSKYQLLTKEDFNFPI